LGARGRLGASLGSGEAIASCDTRSAGDEISYAPDTVE